MAQPLLGGVRAAVPRARQGRLRLPPRGAVATEHVVMLTLLFLALVASMTALGFAVAALVERGSGPL